MNIKREAARLVVDLEDEAETDRLGNALAALALAGRTIGLVGGLGSGKTRLTRALAEALGVDPAVIASPTFVLVHEYEGRLQVYHCDAYRLASADEFDALGVGELFEAGGVVVVEWADLVRDRLPFDAWWIALEPTGITSRRASIEAESAYLDALQASLNVV